MGPCSPPLGSWLLIYRLLRWGPPYVDEGVAAYENRYRQQPIRRLAATANPLGFQLSACCQLKRDVTEQREENCFDSRLIVVRRFCDRYPAQRSPSRCDQPGDSRFRRVLALIDCLS